MIGPDKLKLNAIYNAIAKGDICSIRIGGRILVPKKWLHAFLNGELPAPKAKQRTRRKATPPKAATEPNAEMTA
jgi:hypothetical protein